MASPSPPPTVSELAFTGAESSDTLQYPRPPNDTEKETLESHEVIELQAFSERKAWIEEKIKVSFRCTSFQSLSSHFVFQFLEQLPPIQVFVGIDAVRTSADSVPGLPSREQLQDWLAEHDRIEKETEIFDSGEFKKLRMFTKGMYLIFLLFLLTDILQLPPNAISPRRTPISSSSPSQPFTNSTSSYTSFEIAQKTSTFLVFDSVGKNTVLLLGRI